MTPRIAPRQAKEERKARFADAGAAASFLFGRTWTEYWILSDQYALFAAVGSLGCRRRAVVTLLDPAGGGTGERTRRWIVPGIPRFLPPQFGEKYRLRVPGRGCTVTLEQEGSAHRVFGRAEGFDGGESLLFDVRLTGRSACAVEGRTDFPGHSKWFSHRRLQGVLRADGRAELGGTEYLFAPAHAFGLLEEGRGVWRGRLSVRRAVAEGWADGAPLGLRIGGRAEDNVLLLGGGAWNLGALEWQIPDARPSVREEPANGTRLQAAWRLFSADGRVALTFDPLTMERRTLRRFFRRPLEEIQAFGRFSGQIVLANGREIALRYMAGAAQIRRVDGP